jgi:hypothetical protein
MNETKNNTTFSKAHAAPTAEKQRVHGLLKKFAQTGKSCKHRTETGFCARSHKQCPFFLLN